MSIQITDFKDYHKNTLLGFLTIRIPTVGLEIRDIALHRKNGRRWLQLPAKPYPKQDGTQGWNYIICFPDKSRYRRFEEVTLKALDEFRGEVEGNVNHGTP